MVSKYGQAWSELALAYSAAGFWPQATDALVNAMNLYSKLQHKILKAFVMGEYYYCAMIA